MGRNLCQNVVFDGKKCSAIASCGIDMDTVNFKKEKFAEVYGEINHTMTTATYLFSRKIRK